MNVKKKILVVDDDSDIVEQLTAILGTESYEVFSASGEREAEELLLTVKPDLAILDVMMDQSDSGFVLAHHLRKLYPETPTILLTAMTATTGLSFDNMSGDAGSWLKADKILNKPVRPEQLKAEVRRLLER